MFDWLKKKPVEVAVPVNVTQPEPDLRVLDYPRNEYKVYWETHLFEHPEGPWVGEVRFIGYNGNDHRSYHSVTGSSREHAQQLANKLIVEKMANYKR